MKIIKIGFSLLVFILFWGCHPNTKEISDSSQNTIPDLVQLCERFGTDKCADRHNFISIYKKIFQPVRDSVKNVFEIGILNARSHLMWKEYFINAEVFGIDITDCSRFESQGIKTYKGDQSERKDLQGFINKYSGPFDIIIDDGGHHMDQQQISLGYLFKHLSPGGFYIIEDLHTSIPFYYKNFDGFGVNEAQNNTTLQMVEKYLSENVISSLYMTDSEESYLEKNIENITIYRLNNKMRSMLCVIEKKL